MFIIQNIKSKKFIRDCVEGKLIYTLKRKDSMIFFDWTIACDFLIRMKRTHDFLITSKY